VTDADQTLAATAEQPCDTLFYDGQCPLCAAEISRLREVRGSGLRVADIHDTPLNDTAPDRDTLLRTLHLRRADGSWLTGADANVAAWEGTRQGRWLRILRWRPIRPVVDLVYAWWAAWRYHRLYGRDGGGARDSVGGDGKRR
jgi:predicted DCC family thiol-disulfide oxidoreductase YuxK